MHFSNRHEMPYNRGLTMIHNDSPFMRNFLLINDVDGEEMIDEIFILDDGDTSKQRTAQETNFSCQSMTKCSGNLS